MDKKTISIRVSEDFDRQLRVEAAKRDKDRSTFIRETMESRLAEIKKDQSLDKNNDNRLATYAMAKKP